MQTRRGVRRHLLPFAVGVLFAGAWLVGCEVAAAQSGLSPSATRKVPAWSDSGPLPWFAAFRSATVGLATPSTLEEAIDSCVTDNMVADGAPGAAVAVLLDGEVYYEQGYGFRHVGQSAPVTPQTLFRIGSITKQMTAAAVMQQVEEGRVDLNDPVTALVPEFSVAGPWPVESITVRRLLTHTTGLPDQVADLGPVNDDALSEWAAEQGQTPPHAPPGAFYNYSNPNYALAGLVVERASGVAYRDYFSARLWGPEGLESMTFDPLQAIATGNFAWGHALNAATGELDPISPEWVDSGWLGPAGLAFSTAGDLVRWAGVLMDGGGAILSPDSAAAMQAPQVWTHYTPEMFHGYGIVTEIYDGLTLCWHDGTYIGWSAMLLWVPEQRFAVAVLANTRMPFMQATTCIIEAAMELPDLGSSDYSTDPSTWGRYTGEYDFMDVVGYEFVARVDLAGETLRFTTDSASVILPTVSATMSQVYPDTFFIDADGDDIPETELTFIAGPPATSAVRWLRNRHAVGARRTPPRGGGLRP